MSNPANNKRKGSDWECRIVDKMRDFSIDAERLHLSGAEDEGDIALRMGGKYHVIEAKYTAKLDATSFLRQSEEEAQNFAEHRKLPESMVHPVVFWRRKGKPDPMDGVAILTVRDYIRLSKGDAK